MATDPVVTDPVATDPVATDPLATDPLATDPTVTFAELLPLPKRERPVPKRPRVKPPSYELTSENTLNFVRERDKKSTTGNFSRLSVFRFTSLSID